MTDERDIERLLDHWLTDGPTEAPGRVLDVVVDRIERQSQRPAWRLDRRTTFMNRSIGAVAAAAAIIVIAVIGYNLIGARGGSSVGVPAVNPAASPSSTARSPYDAVGVPGACDLLTPAEAVGALHVSADIHGLPYGDATDPAQPTGLCYYASGGAELVLLGYEKVSGAERFATWKASSVAQPVSGLGDDAVWDSIQKTLFILKGSRLVDISAGKGAPPMTLETAKAIGAIVAARM